MSDRITVGQLYAGPITPNMLQRPKTGEASAVPEKPFAKVLEDNLLKLSNHAAKRLEQRGIELKTEQMEQIGSALDKVTLRSQRVIDFDAGYGFYRQCQKSYSGYRYG